MPKFTVTIAVNVPSYADIEVEAESQAQAEELVAKSFESEGWNSPYYAEGDLRVWNDSFDAAEDLRVVPAD